MAEYDKYDYWIWTSDYDLETAKAMLKSRRLIYVGFMCHQSVEKALKAIFVRDNPPEELPYIHNLPKIAALAGVYDKFSEAQKSFLEELAPLNIQGRYPKEREKIAALLTKEYCKDLIARTEEFEKWLKTI
jgi:HEPN domain-containing protein